MEKILKYIAKHSVFFCATACDKAEVSAPNPVGQNASSLSSNVRLYYLNGQLIIEILDYQNLLNVFRSDNNLSMEMNQETFIILNDAQNLIKALEDLMYSQAVHSNDGTMYKISQKVDLALMKKSVQEEFTLNARFVLEVERSSESLCALANIIVNPDNDTPYLYNIVRVSNNEVIVKIVYGWNYLYN